jgi:hypothetical protein
MTRTIRRCDLVRLLWAIPVTTSALVLAGCSGGSSTGGASGGPASVASIPNQKSSPSTAPPQAERPLVRMDTSPTEEERLVNLWLKCLDQHGSPKKRDLQRRKPTAAEQARADAAEAACASKEPEYYTDRLKRTDPAAYADSTRKKVRCMKSHGLKIEVDPDGTWGYTDPARDMGSPFVDECERKAFAQP